MRVPMSAPRKLAAAAFLPFDPEAFCDEAWEDCDATRGSSCIVTMHEDRTVIPTFGVGNPNERTVAVTLDGSGEGRVTSEPAGIDCGEDCSHPFPLGEAVTLTAITEDGSQFSAWDGCDEATDDTCILEVNADREVSALFETIPEDVTLTVVSDNCANTAVGEACRASLAILGDLRTWGGMTFASSSPAFTLEDAELLPGFEACLVHAAAPHVAVICPDPVQLDVAMVRLVLNRVTSGEASMAFETANLLPYNGGLVSIDTSSSPLGVAP